MSCNRSDLTYNNWYGISDFTLYLSDRNINDLGAIIAGGQGAALVYEGLVASGVISASLSTGIGLVLAGVIIAYWAWITWSNSGCGVKIHFYLVGTSPSGVYIESQ